MMTTHHWSSWTDVNTVVHSLLASLHIGALESKTFLSGTAPLLNSPDAHERIRTFLAASGEGRPGGMLEDLALPQINADYLEVYRLAEMRVLNGA